MSRVMLIFFDVYLIYVFMPYIWLYLISGLDFLSDMVCEETNHSDDNKPNSK